MTKLSITILGIVLLSGCTITGEPRMDNVAFNNDGYVVKNEKFRNAITVKEVTGFPGTSNFTYSGRLAPNFSDDRFRKAIEISLENANLYGEGYTLDAKLIDSGDWSDWFELSLGDKSRAITINYVLKDMTGNSVFKKDIASEVAITNYSPITPYNITQRDAAEKSYAQNIEKLIEEINKI